MTCPDLHVKSCLFRSCSDWQTNSRQQKRLGDVPLSWWGWLAVYRVWHKRGILFLPVKIWRQGNPRNKSTMNANEEKNTGFLVNSCFWNLRSSQGWKIIFLDFHGPMSTPVHTDHVVWTLYPHKQMPIRSNTSHTQAHAYPSSHSDTPFDMESSMEHGSCMLVSINSSSPCACQGKHNPDPWVGSLYRSEPD